MLRGTTPGTRRASRVLNEKWDEAFLDLIESDPEKPASMRVAAHAALGGMEGADVTMWLVMRGALSDEVRRVHRNTYTPNWPSHSRPPRPRRGRRHTQTGDVMARAPLTFRHGRTSLLRCAASLTPSCPPAPTCYPR